MADRNRIPLRTQPRHPDLPPADPDRVYAAPADEPRSPATEAAFTLLADNATKGSRT